MLTLNNTVSKSCIVLLKVIKGTEALNYKQKVCCKLKKEFVYEDSVMWSNIQLILRNLIMLFHLYRLYSAEWHGKGM